MNLLLSFLLSSFFAKAQSVQPGIWQANSSVTVSGIPLPSSQSSDCITAEQAKDLKKTLIKELEKKGCTESQWTVNGSQVEVSLKCNQSGLKADGHLQGQINPKDYDLTGEATGTYKGIPAHARFILKGQWIKSCSVAETQ